MSAETKSDKVTVLPTEVFVSKHFKKDVAQNQEKAELVKVHTFATEPAKVSVEFGLTMNLGNYESCKISVGLVVPCYREEVNDAYADARQYVEDKMKTEVEGIRAKRPEALENPF
jgi:hypothetical protein